MTVEVIRQSDNGTETLGDLLVFNEQRAVVFKCDTLELPDKNNQRMISCIPKGKYICVKVSATTNIPYQHISISNVPMRSGVCIHKANYVNQLRGCIAVGGSEVDINKDGQKDMTDSGKTFDNLMKILPYSFTLTIK